MKVIKAETIGAAWTKTLRECYEAQHGTLGTTCVTFCSAPFELKECTAAIELDCFLKQAGASSITTVANTIFPNSVWKMSHEDRSLLYKQYLEMWHQIKLVPTNSHGVYFQRLIAFGLDRIETPVNQLEFIIETWKKGNHRFSALQAAITDPVLDMSDARQRGFPCLQQIAFHPKGKNGEEGLEIIAFYANQLLIEKGYGNYLGLYHLGQFMASQMGLSLSSVSCIAGSLKLSKTCNKRPLKDLVNQLTEN